jgi:predicted nucleotidyltransferase
MSNVVDPQLARSITDILRAAVPRGLQRVLLFGSRATANARSDSDVDLLVVESRVADRLAEVQRLRVALACLPHPVDVWVMDSEEFEETRGVIGGLAYPADRYGIVLHADA